jgi:serine/threonine-protein kinase
VRPFPARFAGRFEVRGIVLRSLDKAIAETFGALARDNLVAVLPQPLATELRSGSVNALVTYDLGAVDAYLEHAKAMFVRDPMRWRELGRHAVDGELSGVVRTLLRPEDDIAALVKRGVPTWARLLSFGSWRVGTSASGKVTLAIGELDAVAQPLRLWLVGVVEQTARRAVRSQPRVLVTSGEWDFAPEITCEIG